MLRSLKEVQADDSVVGFYQATTLGTFFGQSLVDTQAIYQEKLRHGGIVIVHGYFSYSFLVYLSSHHPISRSHPDSAGKRLFPCLPFNFGLLDCI
jgi:hypothetical protein